MKKILAAAVIGLAGLTGLASPATAAQERTNGCILA